MTFSPLVAEVHIPFLLYPFLSVVSRLKSLWFLPLRFSEEQKDNIRYGRVFPQSICPMDSSSCVLWQPDILLFAFPLLLFRCRLQFCFQRRKGSQRHQEFKSQVVFLSYILYLLQHLHLHVCCAWSSSCHLLWSSRIRGNPFLLNLLQSNTDRHDSLPVFSLFTQSLGNVSISNLVFCVFSYDCISCFLFEHPLLLLCLVSLKMCVLSEYYSLSTYFLMGN